MGVDVGGGPTLASAEVRALMVDDLPALGLPTSAMSGSRGIEMQTATSRPVELFFLYPTSGGESETERAELPARWIVA